MGSKRTPNALFALFDMNARVSDHKLDIFKSQGMQNLQIHLRLFDLIVWVVSYDFEAYVLSEKTFIFHMNHIQVQ